MKLQQSDWIPHHPFLMQQLYTFGLEIQVVNRTHLFPEVPLPVPAVQVTPRYSLCSLEQNCCADPLELRGRSRFKPYLPLLSLIFFQLSVLLQAVKALSSLCGQPLCHQLV